jgi:hypothetical protein
LWRGKQSKSKAKGERQQQQQQQQHQSAAEGAEANKRGFDFAHPPRARDHKVPVLAFGAAGFEFFGRWLENQGGACAVLDCEL